MRHFLHDTDRSRWAGVLAALVLACATSGCSDATPEPGNSAPSEAQEAPSETQEAAVGQRENSSFDFAALRATAETERARQQVAGCEKGSARACYELGDMLHGGDDIVRDNALSVALIDHACQGGFVRACYDMGVRFHLGVEVRQDLHASRAYFQHACAQESATACHMLARIARDGLGVPVDLALADRYAERSCLLGYSPDCKATWPTHKVVGEHEAALPSDADEEATRAARICDSGLMSGCVELAQAYEPGEGVALDMERAYTLYASACDWGRLDACEVFRGIHHRE